MSPKRHGFVAGFAVLAIGLAGCGTDEPADVAGAASARPTASPGPAAPTTPASLPATPPATSAAAPAPVDDGCPPDVNLLYEWLKATPAIVDEIDSSLTGLQKPTCADGWAAARTVVKNADPVLVLFKRDPETGRFDPVAAGTDGVCDGAVKVPAKTQAKLGPGC